MVETLFAQPAIPLVKRALVVLLRPIAIAAIQQEQLPFIIQSPTLAQVLVPQAPIFQILKIRFALNVMESVSLVRLELGLTVAVVKQL